MFGGHVKVEKNLEEEKVPAENMIMGEESKHEDEEEPQKEEPKEGEVELDDKVSLKDICNNQNQLQLEVQAFFKISVEVYGKGRDYSGSF